MPRKVMVSFCFFFAICAAVAAASSDDATSQLLADLQKVTDAMGPACSGPNLLPQLCTSFWTTDTTIYDMVKPLGVIRGRAQWTKILEGHKLAFPESDTRKFEKSVVGAGFIPGTELAWCYGEWMKSNTETAEPTPMSGGTYSAIMKKEAGMWKFFIVGTVQYFKSSWEPVKHGRGGATLKDVQQIVQGIAQGLNKKDYDAAFSSYATDAVFPCMSRLGGTDLKFAKEELARQAVMISSNFVSWFADEVLFPVPGNPNFAVAHGWAKMVDGSSKLYTFGRFTFLLVLEREDTTHPWKIKIDFNPNAWMEDAI